MIIAIDIDDVIADFVPTFINYYNTRFGTNYKDTDIVSFELHHWLKTTSGNISKELMNLQIEGELFNQLPVIEGASYYIYRLKEEGHKIIIITSRINASQTINWLERNGIVYDNLFLVKKKADFLSKHPLNIDLIIDDHPDTIRTASHGNK